MKVAIEIESAESAGRGSPEGANINDINKDINGPATRHSFGGDVEKIGTHAAGGGRTQERKAVKVVDLSGKRIRDDGEQKDDDSDSSE